MSANFRKLILLPLIVLAAGIIALWTREPPAPSAKSGFNLSNAQAIVADIARAPHPVGTTENVRVRQALISRFQALGLIVASGPEYGVRQAEKRKGAISVAPLQNIIAVLPGRDPAKPAVAIMAHFDSAPWSHGASDDGAGVAAVLEVARILKAGPKPARDVVFLLTDAEEAGLLGAQSFFEKGGFARRIGIVVNVEARGSSGRTFMFQTSPGNAELIDLWAKNAIWPAGNSLAGAVYKRLPNDTDLSVPLAMNIDGINGAFIDGLPDYHMPTDNTANLDPRALQHLGDFAVTTTRALALAENLPSRAKGDSAYFDIFGLGVVRYPVGWGWLLFGLGVAGMLFSRCHVLGVTGVVALKGALHVTLLTAAAGAAAHFLLNFIYGSGRLGLRERVAEMPLALWVVVALCAGMTLAIRPRAIHWAGAVVMALLFALAAQIWMPGAHWLFAMPGLIGVAILGIAARKGVAGPATLVTSFVVGGFFGTLLLQGVITTYVSVAMLTPAVVALVIPFTLALIGPLMIPYGDWIWGRRIGFGLIGLGLLGSLWLYASSGFSARHPKPGDLFHWTDTTSGKGYWVTSSGKSQLPPGTVERIKPKWANWSIWRRVPDQPAAVMGPEITLVTAGGRGTLRLASAQPRRALSFILTPSKTLSNATLNGKPVGFPGGKPTRVMWRAESPAEMTLAFDAPPGEKVAIDWLAAAPGLPGGGPQPEGPPTDWMPLTGSTVATGVMTLNW